MKKEIEIERRFLLKKLPDIKYDEIIDITQYYIKIDGIWERYRKSIYPDNMVKYYKTIKKFIRVGEREEDENEITSFEYNIKANECNSGDYEARVIKKKRYIHNLFDGLKWEIDKFEFNVIAEIEVPKLSYKIVIPDWLEKEIITEITKYKEFSSKSLATRL